MFCEINGVHKKIHKTDREVNYQAKHLYLVNVLSRSKDHPYSRLGDNIMLFTLYSLYFLHNTLHTIGNPHTSLSRRT